MRTSLCWEAVIITAASGCIGIAAIQIANSLGAIPIATTRTAAKRAALLAAGAAYVIATDEQDLAAEVMRVTEGRGARLAFDPIGGPGVEALAAALGGARDPDLLWYLDHRAHAVSAAHGISQEPDHSCFLRCLF
ncbi:MAG: zinc-binding dehydrogenase [Acetobacteraceae bacterium]